MSYVAAPHLVCNEPQSECNTALSLTNLSPHSTYVIQHIWAKTDNQCVHHVMQLANLSSNPSCMCVHYMWFSMDTHPSGNFSGASAKKTIIDLSVPQSTSLIKHNWAKAHNECVQDSMKLENLSRHLYLMSLHYTWYLSTV